MREVFGIGSAVSPVRRLEPGTGRVVARDVAVAAMGEAGIDFTAVDGVWAGVALGASPRAVFVAKELGLTGVPVQQVVNASASGLAAVHEARLAIASGEHDLVLVLGYDVPDYPATAEEAIARQGFLPPVALFALWAAERARMHGTSAEHLATVAAKNWNYARTNVNASRRADHEVSVEEVLGSRTIAGVLTSMMCTPWGDGAGALVLASEKGLARARPALTPARLASSVLVSEVYGPLHTFEGAVVGPREMTSRAGSLALARAQLSVADIDVVQVHDAFANEELEYAELLGFVDAGGADKLVVEGAFGPGSRERFGLPEFSTDGGLIGRGHASGASGIAQVHETRRRFAEHGDSVGLCHLMGAGSVCVVQAWVRADR